MALFTGSSANDTLDGGSSADQMYGEGGSDRVWGNGGNDTLVGDGSAATSGDRLALGGIVGGDYLRGFDGDDVMYGDFRIVTATQGGNDVMYGDGGNDMLYGGSGNDSLHGDAGNDLLDGGVGDDWLDASDAVEAGQPHGNDTIYSGWGDDLILVDGGFDVVFDKAGNDQLKISQANVDQAWVMCRAYSIVIGFDDQPGYQVEILNWQQLPTTQIESIRITSEGGWLGGLFTNADINALLIGTGKNYLSHAPASLFDTVS
jgi:Ca2+-binding RTX toxin-like protein